MPEFEWNVVKALVNMERYKEAEEEVRVPVKEYPGNYFTADVKRHAEPPTLGRADMRLVPSTKISTINLGGWPVEPGDGSYSSL